MADASDRPGERAASDPRGEAGRPRLRAVDPPSPPQAVAAAAAEARRAAEEVAGSVVDARRESIAELTAEMRRLRAEAQTARERTGEAERRVREADQARIDAEAPAGQ